MELVQAGSEFYVVDFDWKGTPAFAGGPVPREVLEMLTGVAEDEDIMEGYFCYYPKGDPEELAGWLLGQAYVVLSPEHRRGVAAQAA